MNAMNNSVTYNSLSPEEFKELLKNCTKESFVVIDSLTKAYSVFNRDYKTIVCAVSGGSDSDLMIDICKKFDPGNKRVIYVWVDTGLEYQATKDHLVYLENRYDIEIKRVRAKMPIPTVVRKYGQPFISKVASEYIHRLQLHNFEWTDEPFEVLLYKYPRCKSALEWWCNKNGDGSSFNICRNKYLKEFMIANPPTFKISSMCCMKAKKETMDDILKYFNADINLVGVRKAEGGARASIKACFAPKGGKHDYDTYRPLFWYRNEDKRVYERHYDICHSKCYSEYGLKRTGCVGCPFALSGFEQELMVCDRFEPKLSAACRNIFKDSYDYTRKYIKFVKALEMKQLKRLA